MKIHVTGSKAHRVWKCPPSAVLPQVVDDDRIHAWARGKGKLVHAFLENVGELGRDLAMKQAPAELWPLLQAIDLDDLPAHLSTEVAFAWNWKTWTARELGRNLDRNYDQVADQPDPTCEIAITLDAIGAERIVSPGHDAMAPVRGYVGDYKTGHSKYPAPDQFAQTLLGALCVRALYGCDQVVVELIHIHDDSDHHKSRRTVDDWDLDVFARELQAAMELVAYWEAEYNAGRAVAAHEGPWCDYCEAYMACPAKVQLVKAIPAELHAFGVRPNAEGVLELAPGVITVRNAADAWMTLERISEWVGRAQQQVIGIASFEDVPLPDGRVVGRVVGEKRTVNAQIAGEVLEKRYGAAERLLRIKQTITLDAIHHAVVANIKPGEKMQTKKGDGVEDKLLAEIDRLGGIETKVTEAIRPHVPKKKRLPSG